MVDAARDSFRVSLADTVKSRRTNLSNQASGLQSAVSVAFTTAQSGCDSGVDPATVRSTLLDSLRTSRQTFANLRKSDTDIKDEIAALAKTRNQTIKAADETFLNSVKQAVTTLKTAFGEASDSI